MSNTLKPAVTDEDHLEGNKEATLELVEYGDYECPHCGHAHPILKKIVKEFGPRLKFVFRNFPLSEMHPHAVSAAVAAEAAARQGKFWEMHDIIFEHQHHLEPGDLHMYAKKIGLDLQQFMNDIQDNAIIDHINDDIESGLRSGVNGTPSFYINGKKYEGDWEFEPFAEYLEANIT